MGCNAWNHSADCTCGWGGDTGGGGFRAVPVPTGFEWRTQRNHATYTNPNARCPVCGAEVFYCQFLNGGRVFFDKLGPPWPKHECTDNWVRGGMLKPVLPSLRVKSDPDMVLLPRDQWRPLLPETIELRGDRARLRLGKAERLPGHYLEVPAEVLEAPSRWRWCPDDPASIELSFAEVTPDGCVLEHAHKLPAWLRNDGDREAFVRGEPLSADTLNAIGWSLSFAWRVDGYTEWTKLPSVDLPLARSYFERAAALGHWAAVNNLGVMARDGVGCQANPVTSYRLFHEAAESLDVVPLRHLARCYRDGVGVEPNPEFLAFLEELIAVRVAEEKGAEIT